VNNPTVHFFLGQAYAQEKDYSNALSEFKTALEIDARLPEAHYFMGLVHLRQSDFESAGAEFRSELEIRPGDPVTSYHLGYTLLMQGHADQAAALLREVVQAKPDYEMARFELGRALLQQGDAAGAIESLEAAIKLSPDRDATYFQLSQAYRRVGRLDEAQQADQMARQLGVDVQIVYADNDAITQSTQILKAIQADETQRPDAVVFEPVGGTALPQVARAAVAARVGWAVLNRDASYIPELRRSSSAPVFGVSSDHLEIGRIQGRQFAALLPKGGSILYIQGPAENSAAKERTTGMQETKPSNIHFTLLRAQWTEESAQRSVRSWLKLSTSQKATIDVIGAQDDSMAIGARKAFEELPNESEQERWLKLPFTGCDGLPKT